MSCCTALHVLTEFSSVLLIMVVPYSFMTTPGAVLKAIEVLKIVMMADCFVVRCRPSNLVHCLLVGRAERKEHSTTQPNASHGPRTKILTWRKLCR